MESARVKLPRKVVLALVILGACASHQQTVTNYASEGTLAREAVELHPDGTFLYCSWSDDGPALLAAQGTWRWLDDRQHQLETVVLSRRLLRGSYIGVSDDLPDLVIWTADRDNLRRANRPILTKSRQGALADGDCASFR